MKLILFDIDGTLLSAGGAGTKSLELAFRDLFSIDNAFTGIGMAGKTDVQIIKEGLAAHNLESKNGAIPELIDLYLGHLRNEMNNDRKHLKPGISTALKRLKQERDYPLGLLTGNLEEGARIKLGIFDLNLYFASGAFGSDDEDRNRLLPIAVKRFKEISGLEISFRDCIIVGDTPRDVFCAKPYGAFCIGVATGPYPSSELVKAGADIVFENLMDTDAFMNAIK